MDIEISRKLRIQGIITTLGAPFKALWKKEINGLIAKGVFEFVLYDSRTMSGLRLFNSRLVDEVKGKTTNTPYEKSRLVIQAYNDEGKKEILTQLPTIQQVSQRLLLALTPLLIRKGKARLYLRNIT